MNSIEVSSPMKDDWQIMVEERYSSLIEKGFSQEEAQAMSLEEYAPKDSASARKITLRKHYSLIDLEELKVVVERGGWSKCSDDFKVKLLWHLGLNTETFEWGEEFGPHSDNKGRRVTGIYVFGQERTDHEWVNKKVGGVRVASMAAQTKARGDTSLEVELRKMGGTI